MASRDELEIAVQATINMLRDMADKFEAMSAEHREEIKPGSVEGGYSNGLANAYLVASENIGRLLDGKTVPVLDGKDLIYYEREVRAKKD